MLTPSKSDAAADRPGVRPSPARRTTLALLGLALCAMTVWTMFHQLGVESLADWDEATHAESAREMLRTGHWNTPLWNGHTFYDKPPLVFWLMSVAMSIVPTPELAVRLAPALCGVAVIALTVWLASEMFGGAAGLIAGLVLLVGSQNPYPNFVRLARAGMLDVPLTACTVWTLCHFYRGFRRPRAWALMGLPVGLAFMVKSFAAATPVVAVAGSLLLLRPMGVTISRSHWRSLAIAGAVAAAVALPWHAFQLVEHGREFFHDYVVVHIVDKTVTAVAGNGDGRLFYVRQLRMGLPGWFWIIAPAVALGVWRIFVRRDRDALMLLMWIGLPFILFNIARTKLSWYLVPTYPGLAILIAGLLVTLIPQSFRAGVVAVLLAATVLWNVRTMQSLDWTRDVRKQGACVQAATSAGQTIAFFDAERRYDHPGEREYLNIRPAVRFYADRPMIAFIDRPSLEHWLRDGGEWVWAEEPGADGISDLLDVAARFGHEVLFRRRSAALPVTANPACVELAATGTAGS